MLGVKMASIIQGYRSIFLKMYSLPGNLYPFDQPFNKNSCLGEVIIAKLKNIAIAWKLLRAMSPKFILHK